MDLRLFLIIHTVVSLVFLLFGIRNFKRQLCLFVPVFLLPVFGIIGVAIAGIAAALAIEENIDDRDLAIPGSGLEYTSQVDADKEMNIVPVEEALVIDTNDTKRKMVTEIIKRQPSLYLQSLKKALDSEDGETSHYAASSITDTKRRLARRITEASQAYMEDMTSKDNLEEYVYALNAIIDSKLSVEMIQEGYKLRLTDLLIEWLDNNDDKSDDKYKMLINSFMDLNQNESALYWAERYRKAVGSNEGTLMALLSISYKTGENNLFEKTLNELKNSNFAMTQKTRDTIKYLQNGTGTNGI